MSLLASVPASASEAPEESGESELVRRAREGDRAAARALFERYCEPLMAFCFLAARRDRERAKDLMQESFAKAFGSLEKLGDPEKFRSWLFSIAANLSRNAGEQEQRQRSLLEVYALEQDAGAPAEEKLAREERIAAVRRALAQVDDPKLREIVQLKYGEPEHTTREIAAKLEIPHGTVTVKLMRFRAAIRRDLCRALAQSEEAA